MNEADFSGLIQQEIDGTNTPADSARLRSYLARNAAARELYSDLVRLSEILDQIEDVEPPRDLQESIHDAIAAEEAAQPRDHTRFPIPAALRYAAALAAGLILGLLVAPVVWQDITGIRPSDLGGTMSPRVALQRFDLDGQGLAGSVTLDQDGATASLHLDITVTDPIRVSLQFDDRALTFAGIGQQDEGLSAMEVTQGAVWLSLAKSHRCTVFLERTHRGEAVVTLEFLRDGQVIEEGSLRVLAGGREDQPEDVP